MSIRDIVNVQITRETTAVSQAGFGTVMILGPHKVFNERLRYFQSADQILEDGFTVNDPIYVAGLSVFSQSPSPVRLAIGRRSVDNVVVEVVVVDDTALYTVTINGEEFTYQAVGGNDADDITLGLVTAINAGNEPVTATDNQDGTFDIDADVNDEAYTLSVDAKLEVGALQASATMQDDLSAVNEFNDDWYGLVVTTRVQAEVEQAALWTEARIKLFGTSSQDPDVLDSASTTDIAFFAKDNSLARTFVVYHDNADNIYPEAAWFGTQFPTPPGSSTWAFKTLTGISTVNLTTTERTNVLDKNANTYELRGGVSITREGKVGEGDFIDVIRGVDWLQARMTERIFSRLVNLPKIPFTDPGVAIIENEIRAQLDQAIVQGVLAGDPEPVITVPRVRDVSFNDRANRFLPDVTFRATLAGAIHSLEVRGVVSV